MKHFLHGSIIALATAVSYPKDTSNTAIQVIRDGLCIDSAGELLFQASATEVSNGQIVTSVCYLNKAFENIAGELKSCALSSVVDKASWKAISLAQYYQDKNRIYVFVPSLPHGKLRVLGALTPSEFKIMHGGKWLSPQNIPDRELNPKRRVHYTLQGNVLCFDDQPVPDADAATFKIIKDVDGLTIESYATDRHNIYEGGKVISRDKFLEQALALALANKPESLEYARAMAELIGGVSVE